MRDPNRYKCVEGRLRFDLMERPQNKGQPYSRPVIESGTAYKTVYLSKAAKTVGYEKMAEVLDYHEYLMRKELQASGKIVRKVTRTITGQEGDCRIIMTWEVLGAKRTKHYRRAMMGDNAANAGNPQGESEAGHSPTSEGA